MTTITTRSGKGSPLTNDEVDANFTGLNTDKVETSGDSMTGDLSFGDNVKATFGSDDLQIYHDGTRSYISDSGTGDLRLQASEVRMVNAANTEVGFKFVEDGAASLYFNANEKLATTGSGIDVSGTVTADALDIDNLKILSGQSTTPTNLASPLIYKTTSHSDYGNGDLIIQARSSASRAIYMLTGTTTPVNRLRVGGNGDISFYDSSGTSQSLLWDASAESLGIGTSSPASAASLHLKGAGGTELHMESGDGASTSVIKHNQSNDSLEFYPDGSLALTLQADNEAYFTSNVGIGTSSPSASLALDKNTTTQHRALDLENNSITYSMYVDQDNSSTNSWSLFDTTNSQTALRYLPSSSGYWQFYTNNSEAMRIDSSGRVGIGTSLPSYTISSRNDSAISYPLSLESATLGTVGNTVGMLFGFSGNTYQKGAIIFESLDSNARGKMHFALDNSAGSGNVQLSDAKMTIDYAGNVGIGTSSPSAVLDIQTPNAGSDLRLTATDGSSGASARFTTAAGNFYVGLDTSTGGTFGAANHAVLWHDSAYGITFATNNSRRMTIDSSGQVGIGTSSPSAALHVSASPEVVTKLSRSAGSNALVLFEDPTSTNAPYIGSYGNAMAFGRYGGGEAMRIDSSGNLLVGKNSNAISGQSNSIQSSAIVSTSGPLNSHTTSAGVFEFNTNKVAIRAYGATAGTGHMSFNVGGGGGSADSEAMRIDSSGNLLVGKTAADNTSQGVTIYGSTAPGAASFVRDAGNTLVLNRLNNDGEILAFRKDNTTVGSIGAKAGDVYLETGDTGIRMYDQSDAIIPVGSSGISRDAAINLGISFVRFKDLYLSNAVHATHINLEDAGGTHRTALDFDASSNLKVSTGASAGSRAITFFTENTEQMRLDASGNLLVGRTTTINFPTNTTSGIRLGANRFDMAADSLCRLTQLNNASGEFDRFYIGSSIIGSITGSGSTTSYNTSSDQRLKDNIVDAPSASDDIDAIQVRSFDWKADGSHQKYGMVAQELNTVAPEAVSAPEDPEEMMGVDYSKLVPMLVKEIQSLRARVAQLETN